jgi:flagellar hook assembly protein FlgD
LAALVHVDNTTAARERQAIPVRLVLAARPNPFNSATLIRFGLPAESRVTVDVFDSQGRLVRSLVRGGLYPAGENEISWNGHDDKSGVAGAGVYFIKLTAGPQSRVTRAVKLR